MAPDERIPERIGRYEILDLLGEGGMSQVYAARRVGAAEVAVLKRVRADLTAQEAGRRRLEREAHLASFLLHPNIARITGAGVEDDSFCVAMEYVPGRDLAAVLGAHTAGPLPLEVALAIGARVLDGLAHAHDARGPDGEPLEILHRDLSARNVMIGFDGAVKIIDFGLVRGNLGRFKTEPGTLLGTVHYMSPEQAAAGDVDRRSDLYSAGVILYELLTGHGVVPGGTLLEMLVAVQTHTPQPPTALNPALPASLDAVIMKAIAKDPNSRHANAAELRAALLAAVPRTPADTPAIAALMTALFPGERARANELQALARARAGYDLLPATPGEADLHAETRTARPDERARRVELPPPAPRWTMPIVLAAIAAMMIGGALAMIVRDGAPAPGERAGAGAGVAVSARRAGIGAEGAGAGGAPGAGRAGVRGDEDTLGAGVVPSAGRAGVRGAEGEGAGGALGAGRAGARAEGGAPGAGRAGVRGAEDEGARRSGARVTSSGAGAASRARAGAGDARDASRAGREVAGEASKRAPEAAHRDAHAAIERKLRALELRWDQAAFTEIERELVRAAAALPAQDARAVTSEVDRALRTVIKDDQIGALKSALAKLRAAKEP